MEIAVFTTFLLKHFFLDFIFQFPYHYQNKGKYGHPGGISHALLHSTGTLIIVMIFFIPVSGLLLALILYGEFVIHYHVDWAKVNISKKLGWGPNTSDYYWWLLGLDQLLHYLTYVGIMLILL